MTEYVSLENEERVFGRLPLNCEVAPNWDERNIADPCQHLQG